MVFHKDAPENEKLVLKKEVYSRFGQSYESRCGASVGTAKKLFKIRRRTICVCFEY